MRRRRYDYNSRTDYDSEYHDAITLTDFRFYNKKKKVIDNEVLNNIEKYIMENPSSERFWTNKTFWKEGVCFGFFYKQKEDNYTKEITKEVLIRFIEFDTIKKDGIDLNKITTAFAINKPFIILFEPTLSQKDFIRYLIDRVPKSNPLIVDTWSDVINFTIKNDLFQGDYDDWREFKDDIQLTFNYEIVDRKFNVVSKSDLNRSTARFIYEVIEQRIDNVNYRVALCRGFNRYSQYYHIKVFAETSNEYNFIDKDRLYFVENIANKTKYYFLDNGLLETNNNGILIHLDMFGVMHRNLHNILGDDRNVITAPIYRFYRERFSESLFGSSETNEVEIDIINKYTDVLKSGREIKIDDVIISNKVIRVDGQAFVMKFNKEFFNTSNKIKELRRMIKSEDIRYNFNLLYENIIKHSILEIVQMDNTSKTEYKLFTKTQFIINDKHIVVEKINNRIKINDIYCRIDDIYEVLNRAICFNTLDDFNKYVKDVSFVGHEWIKLISTGVQIQLANPFARLLKKIKTDTPSELNLRFSFSWNPNKRSEIFLLLNSQKYLIKNKMKFKRTFSLPKLTMNMSQLKKGLTQAIPDLTDDIIVNIVDDAIAEGEIIQKRAIELVANTVRDIKAQEVEIQINNITMKGYLFTGRISGSEYFVNRVDLNVFKKANGVWNRRCVVNDHTKQRIFEDWLANRLVNIYNEPLYIFTLHNI